jgi:glutaredoxin 3
MCTLDLRRKGDVMSYSEEEARAFIRDIIATNHVVVFLRQGCPYCNELLRRLKENKWKFAQVDLGRQDPIVFQTLCKMTDHQTVPKVWVQQEFVGGCSEMIRRMADGM